jgi:hypothetical protein
MANHLNQAPKTKQIWTTVRDIIQTNIQNKEKKIIRGELIKVLKWLK